MRDARREVSFSGIQSLDLVAEFFSGNVRFCKPRLVGIVGDEPRVQVERAPEVVGGLVDLRGLSQGRGAERAGFVGGCQLLPEKRRIEARAGCVGRLSSPVKGRVVQPPGGYFLL